MRVRNSGLYGLVISLVLVFVAGGGTAAGPRVTPSLQQWLQGPVRVEVRNEVDGKTASFEVKPTTLPADSALPTRALDALGLSVTERFSATERGMAWDFEFTGQGPRTAHEVSFALPVLTGQRQVFTPGERGIMALSAYPTFAPVPYGTMGWSDGRCYVLPLVSVLDPQADTALTVAVPADANIPQMQVDWQNAATLRVRLGHRGMGGAKPSALRLLFYTHPADYRAAIKAYSDDFPRYFRPVQPRGTYEGAFWYHHIHTPIPADNGCPIALLGEEMVLYNFRGHLPRMGRTYGAQHFSYSV